MPGKPGRRRRNRRKGDTVTRPVTPITGWRNWPMAPSISSPKMKIIREIQSTWCTDTQTLALVCSCMQNIVLGSLHGVTYRLCPFRLSTYYYSHSLQMLLEDSLVANCCPRRSPTPSRMRLVFKRTSIYSVHYYTNSFSPSSSFSFSFIKFINHPSSIIDYIIHQLSD